MHGMHKNIIIRTPVSRASLADWRIPQRRQPDLDLLTRHLKPALDQHGRLRDRCGVTLVLARDGQAMFVGSEVPEPLVAELAQAMADSSVSAQPRLEPPALQACRAILKRAGRPLSLEAAPFYVFTEGSVFKMNVDIQRSDDSSVRRLLALNPGNWANDEWAELLAGALGPWAIALVNGRVASICHTPRPMNKHTAECGIWTDPDFRGRGYAAATASAWAEIVRPSGRHLIYSTTAENRPSQRVAARLGLRPIGWTWTLAAEDSRPPNPYHPLSTAAARWLAGGDQP